GSFLISFTEIPREYISVDLAGCIHYFLRFMIDVSLIELAAEHFGVWPNIRKVLRPLYAALLSLFVVQFVLSLVLAPDHPLRHLVGFDGAYELCQLGLPFIIIPLAYGLISSWKKRKEQGYGFVALFTLASLIQLNDRLVFLQIVEQV